MVEHFGMEVHHVTGLFLINLVANIIAAPFLGKAVSVWGERRALIFEYIGLAGVFTAYAFVESPWVAAGLYLLDHAFFALAIAINTGTNIPSVATPNGQAAFLFLLTSSLAPLIRLSYGRMVIMAVPYTLVLGGVGLAAVVLFI